MIIKSKFKLVFAGDELNIKSNNLVNAIIMAQSFNLFFD